MYNSVGLLACHPASSRGSRSVPAGLSSKLVGLESVDKSKSLQNLIEVGQRQRCLALFPKHSLPILSLPVLSLPVLDLGNSRKIPFRGITLEEA